MTTNKSEGVKKYVFPFQLYNIEYIILVALWVLSQKIFFQIKICLMFIYDEKVLLLNIFLFFTFKAFTMPEYLRKRFGGKRIRMYCSFFALIGYILFNISVCTITFMLIVTCHKNILERNTSCF